MGKWIGVIVIATVLIAAGGASWEKLKQSRVEPPRPTPTTIQRGDTTVVADGLEIPWEVAWLANGDMLVTERPGRLVRIGSDKRVYPIAGIAAVGEGGLLGLAVRGDDIYLYLTTNTKTGLQNRVVKYKLAGDELTDQTVIVDNIPGGTNHDGGRIAFGPDGYLYITTGEAGQASLAQDEISLAGKILRHKDGKTEIYSWGHRNPQGLAWDSRGRLWATEHGRSGIASGYDELNLIQQDGNYGWPAIQGEEAAEGMITPVINSGSETTWAPAGAVFWDGSILFAGLRGQALYEYHIADKKLVTHLKNQYGRLRAVAVGPDGMLYVSTSNRDGRGSVKAGDDKILKINPKMFRY